MSKDILMIKFHGYPLFVPMINDDYDYFARVIPIKAPPQVDDNSLWYINLKEFKIEVIYKKGATLMFTFEVGFRTDNGSVPQFGQGLIRNNEPDAMVGFWIHDLLYQTHDRTFRQSNIILKQICEYYGLGWFKTNVIFQSVERFGKKIYKNRTPEFKGSVKKIVHKP